MPLFITPLNKQLCERIVGRRKLLGEDLVFDLQGLLVERFGVNLRNRMAHGLMGTNSPPRTSCTSGGVCSGSA